MKRKWNLDFPKSGTFAGPLAALAKLHMNLPADMAMVEAYAESVSTPVATKKTNAEKCRHYREKQKARMAKPLIEPATPEPPHETPSPIVPEPELLAVSDCPPVAPEVAVRPDITRPPKRMPARIKGIWQTLSPEVREDIISREVEFDQAFKRYDGLGKFAIEAERNGTTLVRALTDLTEAESWFRADHLEAVMRLWARLGHDPGVTAIAFAERFLPEPLNAAWEAGRQAGFAEGDSAGAISQFAVQHADFEFLRPQMAKLAAADPALPIEKLYEQARWIDPISREDEIMRFKRTANQLHNNGRNAATMRALNAVDQARSQAKAVVGAPSTGKKPPPAASVGSVEDDVRKAVARQKG